LVSYERVKKKQPSPIVLIIVGPTASGKTALSIKLARRFNGAVISADSRQVYRGLNIGTGKITKREMRGIPHYCLDVADPKRRYSAARFKRDADKALRTILAQGKLPIVCGGTGFYIDALFGNVTLPDVPPNPTLRKTLKLLPAPELFKRLQKLDPARAKTIDPHNSVRLIRAIEIARALGKVPAQHYTLSTTRYTLLKIGLTLPREELKKLIYARLKARVRQGLIAEGKRLHSEGLSFKRMEELGLEYRYLARYLQGKLSRAQFFDELYRAICNYAKRQETYFKRYTTIQWYLPTRAKKWLGRFS
jgi:tRNA dimethylallyltransferase